jgi:hypothetical protein
MIHLLKELNNCTGHTYQFLTFMICSITNGIDQMLRNANQWSAEMWYYPTESTVQKFIGDSTFLTRITVLVYEVDVAKAITSSNKEEEKEVENKLTTFDIGHPKNNTKEIINETSFTSNDKVHYFYHTLYETILRD